MKVWTSFNKKYETAHYRYASWMNLHMLAQIKISIIDFAQAIQKLGEMHTNYVRFNWAAIMNIYLLHLFATSLNMHENFSGQNAILWSRFRKWFYVKGFRTLAQNDTINVKNNKKFDEQP